MVEKIPYYRVKKGYGYFQPTDTMKALGFRSVPCGRDGPEAHAIAREWVERWKRTRKAGSTAASAPRTAGYVYFLQVGNRIKIGFSVNPFTRAAAHRTSLPAAIDLMLAVPGTVADERSYHARFAAYRQKGEWFVAAAPLLREMMRIAGNALAKNESETEVGTPAKIAG
ncbi:GIY-YIG nuclease family protein [Devosia albogilva]|uniref:GIY-YIG nuclease family protein n=1 Tax=Devosia albogilva TaxID=429726 RepID=A0ABW5QFI8_9HYPH